MIKEKWCTAYMPTHFQIVGVYKGVHPAFKSARLTAVRYEIF